MLDLRFGFADQDTITLLSKKWVQMYGTELVFFIDEFAATNIVKQEELAFLRRRLMDVGACVIVASTDSGAMKMFGTQAASIDSREALDPWVQLSTQLPKYVPPTRLRTLLDRCNNPAVKTLIELCLQSRPLFASAVCQRMEELLNSDTSSINKIDFFDDLRDKLVDVLRSKVTAGLPEGCLGYVTAMLLAGGALISADEANIGLFGNLTNKNWAYLVHDPIVLSDGALAVDAAKRARLQTSNGASEVQDRFVRMSMRHSEATFLLLWRKAGLVSGIDRLQFNDANNKRRNFSCTSFFPDPSEDFLLYLVLAGSKMSPGLEVFNDAGCRRRVSVATLLKTVFNKKLPLSVNDIVPSFAYLEALVCAAFYTACNAGSLSGCSLEELLTRFVAELMVPFNSAYPALTKVDKVPLVSQEFTARFVFPFDTSLPNKVHQILHTAQVSRPATGECVDVVTSVPNESTKKMYPQQNPTK